MNWYPRGPFDCRILGRRLRYRSCHTVLGGWFPTVLALANFTPSGTHWITRTRQVSEVLIFLVVERDGIVHARNMSSIFEHQVRVPGRLGVHCGRLRSLSVEDFRARRPGEVISCEQCFRHIEHALESYYKRSAEHERIRNARALRNAEQAAAVARSTRVHVQAW